MSDPEANIEMSSPPASQVPPASVPKRVSPPAADQKAKKRLSRINGQLLSAFGGMVLGAIIGVAVEAGIESTGVLGPGLDELLTEQTTNFEQINAKLEALKGASDPERVQTLMVDLENLLAQQESLTQRANEELRGARQEIERLKQAALEAQTSTGGAGVWLKAGESITVGEDQNVFGFIGKGSYSGTIYVNASGTPHNNVKLGDFVEFTGDKGTYRVFYKQAEPRADGRIGFDVIRLAKSET